MTLEEHRKALGLSQAELGRLANISAVTISKAENGETISGATARAICQVLTKEMGKTIRISDITGLKVRV